MSIEHVSEALRLIEAGHGVVQKIRDAAPEDRDPYGKQAMGIWAQAQAHASLAIVDELRRSNDSRDQFYREVLDVLTAAKEPGVCPSTKRGAQPVVGEVHVYQCVLDRGHAGRHASSHDSEGLRWS